MKSWFNKLLGIKPQQAFPIVWDTQLPSIYTRLEPTYAQPHPLAWDNNLVACEPLGDSNEAFWAAGALDGTMIYHFGTASDNDVAGEILAALKAVLNHPDQNSMQTFYNLINEGSPLHYIDDVLKAIPQSQELNAQKLRELAFMLCTQSPDRNPVKFAMALLAYFPQQRSVDVLQVLGRHDEFTLYAVVALRAIVEPEHYAATWFAMAQRVNGWGRVHLMERIPETLDATIQGWLLREGFSNSVMNEYTAVNCAVRGGLLEALTTEHDDALLLGAAEILHALINEGAVSGMSVYDDGEQACLAYLHNILEYQPAHPLHYLTTKRISEWVRSEESQDTGLSSQLIAMCTQVLALAVWSDITTQALAGEEGYAFNLAIDVCRDRQVDPFPYLFERQSDKPESALWYQMMQTEDPGQAYQVCCLAEAQIDLSAIASGPALSSGTGLQWTAHRHLDSVLQELKRFPEMGWPLLETALQSPVIRNRQMAINALETWPVKSLFIHREFIEQCINAEPHEEVQQRLVNLRDSLCDLT